MGGLTVGVLWGLLVAAMFLAALSLSSPLPPRGDLDATLRDRAAVEAPGEGEATPGALEAQEAGDGASSGAGTAATRDGASAETAEDPPPATEVPLPSGSEFNRPPPEPEAALPVPDNAPDVSPPDAPQGGSDVRAPSFDTAPAAQPDVASTAPGAITAGATAGDAPARPAYTPAPSFAARPGALSQPETTDAPRIRTGLLPQIARPEPGSEPEPEPEPEQGSAPVNAESVPAGVDVPTADPMPVPLPTPTFPHIAPEAAAPDVPNDGAGATSRLGTPDSPRASGLPQITGSQAVPEEGASDGAPGSTDRMGTESATDMDEAAVEASDADARQPAIRAFAAPFEAADDRALMAVILLDDPESPIEQATLLSFPFPVSFALDPQHPDAAARAEAYRDAGFEVVIFASMIPEGATAADTEVALSGMQSILPEAVAILDTPGGRVQSDRPVLDAVVGSLQDSGHGLVAFAQGLNAAEQSANRIGVPGATVFRLLDDEDQRATEISRLLARAAVAAGQEGTVIVVGRARPDTVTALFSWALGERSAGVAMAPLSATLLRMAGQ